MLEKDCAHKPTVKPLNLKMVDNALDKLVESSGHRSIAVALSGGLDSMALLHIAHRYAKARDLALYAFHIHHGISQNADYWMSHCASVSEKMDVTFEAQRVILSDIEKTGTEEAARKARYQSLGGMCKKHGVTLMLTAQHLDDQAETVLLQLMRGAGAAGMSGMNAVDAASDLLMNEDVSMCRPLLDVSRHQLEVYVREHGIKHIHDESNDDPKYTRNALRLSVMPVLAATFPGFQERIARSAKHAQSAQRLMDEIAESDLKSVAEDGLISLSKLRALSVDRCQNLLRHWISSLGFRYPSAAWLEELCSQLLTSRSDAQLDVTHSNFRVRRHRDHLHLTPLMEQSERLPVMIADVKIQWTGEPSLAISEFGGVLHFDEVHDEATGLPYDWLLKRALIVGHRRGGDRLKLVENRPSSLLKQHYQKMEIPAWERHCLPVVRSDDQSHLLFAAGIGLEFKSAAISGRRIKLRWELDQ